jgi:hypothetical protein
MAKRGKRRRSGLEHGFVSKAQQRFFFAKAHTNPKFKVWAEKHDVSGARYRALPNRKGRPTAVTGRKVR